MLTKTDQDNDYETEASDSDDEMDIDGKLRLNDSDGEDNGFVHDGSDKEENGDVTTFGRKRKKSSIQRQPSTKKAKKAERKSKEIFVKNLPLGCSEEDLRKDFADYDIIITKMKLRGRANGKTALITTIEEMSESDILSLDGMVVNDCPVIVELAKDKSKVWQGKSKKFKKRNKLQVNRSSGSDSLEDNKKLYVKNLDWNVTEDTLREHFHCRDVHIPKNADGTLKGFAYLMFASQEAAIKASEDLRDSNIDGRIIKPKRVAAKGSGGKAQNNRNRQDGSKRVLHAGRGHARNCGKSSGRGRPKVGSSN